jgi:hypothetical protein
MLFADRAIQEKNGKWGLIGIFNRFTFKKFPTPPLLPWFVYIVLQEVGEGTHEFAVNLIRESVNQVLKPINGELKVADSAQGVTLALPMPGVSFPKPDTYTVKLHMDGTYVTERPLYVLEAPAAVGPGAN